jgi:hypothetical protein
MYSRPVLNILPFVCQETLQYQLLLGPFRPSLSPRVSYLQNRRPSLRRRSAALRLLDEKLHRQAIHGIDRVSNSDGI